MAATLEVQYFNTFWIKKIKSVVDANTTSGPVPPTPPYSEVPRLYPVVVADDWYIEEARIRGGYQNLSVDFGVKAYIEEENNKQQNRFNSIIYSGVFNSRTGINNTNQFSIGEDITKSVDPSYASIQRLYAEDTNLIIFQEEKVSRALIDKDAIYSAEGNASITSSNLVIGQIVAYAGEYGISQDPFSFAVYGYRKYFTDRKRNCVCRLSRDGITEISGYGMQDYFRDKLSTIGNGGKIKAGWDMHTKSYILSLQDQYGTAISATTSGGPFGPNVTTTSTKIILDSSVAGIESGMEVYNTATGEVYGKVISFNQFELIYTGVNNGTSTGLVIVLNPSTPNTIKLGQVMKNIASGVSFGAITNILLLGSGFLRMLSDTFFNVNNADEVGFYSTSVMANLEKQIPANTAISFQMRNYETLSFDESVLGWTSFMSFKPLFMDSLGANFYSFNTHQVYQHHKLDSNYPSQYSMFYGASNGSSIAAESTVSLVLNGQPSLIKTFKTLNYEGGTEWKMESFVGSSIDSGIATQAVTDSGVITTSLPITKFVQAVNLEDLQSQLFQNNFKRKENKYFGTIVNNTPVNNAEVFWGQDTSGVQGFFGTVKMTLVNSVPRSIVNTAQQGYGKKELFAVSTNYVESSY